ncbi:hypothetical protein [Streptomyces caniscabiei]|uniref:hypothetical protein n=1 Tax=Streptomyces caniscabiei TaxID=2746961 RepID=UPI000AE5A565|nr:hypothetical protein [Streptomyces caniscabiei]
MTISISEQDAARLGGEDSIVVVTRRSPPLRMDTSSVRLDLQDIRDEEDEPLPRMRDALGDRRPRQIGAAREAVRAGASTHPHPAIPRRPPGNMLSGPPLSVFDRLRQPQRTLRQFRGRSCERGSVGPRATGYSAPQTQPG